MPDRSAVLVQYYRAMVGRADTWRMRMDTTTHWAIGATAAMLSFALGDPAAPHAVVLVATFLTVIFLLLEARRLTFYHLWQQRVLLLERDFIAPVLAGADAPAASLAPELGAVLGTTAPSMSIAKATARRLRRVYLYLFLVQVLAWGLKLTSHPGTAGSAAQVLDRARLGPVPGAVSVAVVLLALAVALGMAVFAGGVQRGPTDDAQGRRV